MTFVVVGGGPTGVEMAGQIGELATDTLKRDFRHIDPTTSRVLLVEAADRVLGTFPPSLSNRAVRALEHLGATVVVNRTVVGIDADGVDLEAPDGTTERVPTRTVVWAAGVTASGLASELAERTGAKTDRAGRALVQPDLSLPGHPEVLLVGDMVQVDGGDPLPGVAPVAIQQGRYVAKVVGARLNGGDPGPFHYHDKGNVATIGRGKAVAEIGKLRLSGFPAWALWVGDPPLLPDRVPQPAAGADPVDDQLPVAQPRRPVDHGDRSGLRARNHSARASGRGTGWRPLRLRPRPRPRCRPDIIRRHAMQLDQESGVRHPQFGQEIKAIHLINGATARCCAPRRTAKVAPRGPRHPRSRSAHAPWSPARSARRPAR